MYGMFYTSGSFNGDISQWDTSRVTTMEGMFYDSSAFNGHLSEWDISSVTTMDGMFYEAAAFSQYLCWDISHVALTNLMFSTNSVK